MKAAGDLHGVGRTTPGTISVDLRTVPADDRHAGMLLKPGDELAALAFGEQVQDTMCFEVDQYRAVAMASTEGPIINTEHAWSCVFGGGRLSNEA